MWLALPSDTFSAEVAQPFPGNRVELLHWSGGLRAPDADSAIMTAAQILGRHRDRHHPPRDDRRWPFDTTAPHDRAPTAH